MAKIKNAESRRPSRTKDPEKTPISLARDKAPLYYRLAETLTAKIERGEYKKGDLLPGDLQLASEYSVSLITVRAAMRMLIERGLVARYPGRGSFVLSQQQVRAQWGLGSIEDLVRTG